MMKGGNRGLRLLVRLRKYFDAGDVKVDENTRRDIVAGLNELIVEAQEAPDRRYYDAIGMIIVGLEALAKKTLHENPFSKRLGELRGLNDRGDIREAKEAEEEKWRELADASRQLRPLFDAWVRASEPNSESAKYKNGFHRRLMEAMATVAEIAAYGRVHGLKQQKRAEKDRPKAKSPFTEFIVSRLKRNPRASAKEIGAALVEDARVGLISSKFELSEDGTKILTVVEKPTDVEDPPERQNHLKISDIPIAVAKARKKLSKK